jgi:hypothetical protein
MHNETLTIIDNRTEQTYSIPISHGTIRGMDLRQIKTGPGDFGLMTYDPAFMNTASCQSAITYLDGDKGILRYRGYAASAAHSMVPSPITAFATLRMDLSTLAHIPRRCAERRIRKSGTRRLRPARSPQITLRGSIPARFAAESSLAALPAASCTISQPVLVWKRRASRSTRAAAPFPRFRNSLRSGGRRALNAGQATNNGDSG